MANLTNSVNEVKNAKAVQSVTRKELINIFNDIAKDVQNFGGLWEILKLTKRFAYTLTDTKVNDTDIPVIKVGRKSFYLSPVGAVNKANVLNVIKSVLKVEDAKRILAKKLAKRLTFAQFSELSDTQKRIDDMKAALRKYANTEMSEKQEKDTLHNLYNEYLQSLGLEE